jgi:hypothetical protein
MVGLLQSRFRNSKEIRKYRNTNQSENKERDLIEPQPEDKRFARRDRGGRFKRRWTWSVPLRSTSGNALKPKCQKAKAARRRNLDFDTQAFPPRPSSVLTYGVRLAQVKRQCLIQSYRLNHWVIAVAMFEKAEYPAAFLALTLYLYVVAEVNPVSA